MAPVIIAKNIYKCYAGFDPVLRGVNMEADAGEMVAIMGPSGCGKSTLLHILGMLHAPDSGELAILGTDVASLNREQAAAFRRVNMGFVMQSSNLFDHSTVFENVEFPLIYEGVAPQERWARVIRALDLVRLSARVHYRSNRLSGGEQQRAAIARAMVNNPCILLTDEPTGALDARTSQHIMENFRTLCHTCGVCMIMVTHDPKMAEYCDTVYTLEEGVLHCSKRGFTSLAAARPQNFLSQGEAVMRGAFVTDHFAGDIGRFSTGQARCLHAEGLLSRVYALCGRSLEGTADDYVLPLAVRSFGIGPFFSLCALFRQPRKAARDLRKLLRVTAGDGGLTRLRALCTGALLAHWAHEDHLEFFFAAPGRAPLTAVRGAVRLTGLPFVAAAHDRESALAIGDCADAAFVCCDSEQTCQTVHECLPGYPADKILILPGAQPAREPCEEKAAMAISAPPDDELQLSAEARTALSRLKILLTAVCRKK